MKRFLLLFLVLPFLANAQNEYARNLLEKRKFTDLFRTNYVLAPTRASIPFLLDSVYTYMGGDAISAKYLFGRTYFYYGKDNRLETEYSYYLSGWPFARSRKTAYKYKSDLSQQPDEEHVYELINGEWIKDGYTCFKYNESGYPIEITEYLLNEENKFHESYSFTTKEFDRKGMPVLIMGTTMIATYIIEFKAELEFDSSSRLLSIISYEKSIGGGWKPSEKTINEYSSDGLTYKEMSYIWNGYVWEYEDHRIYEKDERQTLIRMAEYDEEDAIISLPSSLEFQNFYSDLVTTDNEKIYLNEDIGIDVMKDQITVSLAKDNKGLFSIYSMAGSLIYSEKLINSTTFISMDRFPKGVYILYVQTQQGIKVRKLAIN